ncbi:MAG: hypothetical protein ACK5GI_08485 [Ignavibacteria bacterium]|jgi:hypothetical protein
MIRVLLSLCLFCMSAYSVSAQTSFITFLHNSPDADLRTVDLYITQAGITSKVEDVNWQSADNLNSVAIFGDLEVVIGVAPSTSSTMSEVVLEHAFTPAPDMGYMAIMHGVQTPQSYAANPDGKSTKLAITSYSVENTNTDPSKTAVYFFHGATDLEKCDFWVRGGAKVAAANMTFTDRNITAAVVERKVLTIDCTKPGDKAKVLASFSVDFASLASSVIVCAVSGFKTLEDNNKSTDTLALLSVLEDGRVVRSPLMAGSQTCRVQLVHAAADPALTQVDVYINGMKAADNLAFRKATGFTPVIANSPIVVGFAPATSTGYKDTLLTITLDPLRPSRTYTIVASGVADTSKFAKNPTGVYTGVNLSVIDGALEQSASAKTSVRAGHFVSDAPVASIVSSKTTYASKVKFTDQSPTYVEVDPAIDTLWLTDADGNKLKGYVCDLRGSNRATLALATGFLNPANNNSGAALKLILVDANGSVNASAEEVDPGGNTSVQEDVLIGRGWSVGPNPASHVLRAQIPAGDNQGELGYALVNAAGQQFATGTIAQVNVQYALSLDVSTIPQGAYNLIFTSADGSTSAAWGVTITR